MPEPETKLLINVLEDETFRTDKRDLEAAELHARHLATTEPIQSSEEAQAAADAAEDLRTTLKRADENRLALTRPIRASEKHVNDQYREVTARAKAAHDALKRRAFDWGQAEKRRIAREQREAQERLDREAEEKAAEAQAAAELAAEEPNNPEARQMHAQAHEEAARAATASAPKPPPPRQVRGSIGKVGSRTEYRHTVVDLAALPADYKTANERAIKAAIKGERAMAKAQSRPFNLALIPGVQIVAEEIPVGGSAVRS